MTTQSQITLQFPIASPGVNHVVAVELLRRSDQLPPGVRKALADATGENGSVESLRRMVVTADLSALLLTASLRQEQEQEALALEKFVARHAHWPLLHHIFGSRITRAEVTAIRKEKRMQPPPRRVAPISDDELSSMWEFWLVVCGQHQVEKDRWFAVSERFPNHPLSAVYRALIIDAAPKKGAKS